MATELEHLDDGEDAQVAWLLEAANDLPAMRSEFVSALQQRLDAEFASMRSGGSFAAALAPHATNGSARKSAVTNDLTEVAPEKEEISTTKRATRSRRRWVLSVIAAASVCMAAAILSNPPAWAAAVRAVIQRIEELATGRAALEAADGEAADENAPVVAVDAAKPAPVVESAPKVARVDNASRIAPTPAKKEYEKENHKSDKPHPPKGELDWKPFDKPLAPGELSQRIDNEIAAHWQKNGIRPVAPATDAEFMRRVYLDLTGRIPTVSEVHEFFDDTSPNRRESLVDRLLEHRDHATHLAAVWHAVLLPAEVDLSRIGGGEKFDEWLSDRFAANVPYDQIVRDLLTAEGRVSESGPLLFYAALKLNPEELAARTSRAFLGVRMECAQCHDHPFDDVSQHDFWSFAAFFARISRPQGKMEVTSNVLAVRDNNRGDVSIPNSKEIVPPRLPLTDTNLEDKPGGPARRKQLVEWLTSPNNGQFARAAVNRVWSQLFGRGIVEPVDDMRPANAPIAPQLLDTLSRDFAASGFDLRRLTRAIVLTKTYQLSSRSQDNEPSRTLNFAQMNIKSFTAEQLYDCIAVSTQKGQLAGETPNELGLVRFADMSRQTFIEQFRAPAGQATDYHAGIPQALTLMHGGLINSATDLGTSGLLKSLAAPFFTDDQRLDTLFLSTLSRHPEAAEREMMLKTVAAAKTDDERQRALGDVLWALLNSAEFTFNH
jgi:uncharacterized protein DUF1549/uncharacterized protein DUF1553